MVVQTILLPLLISYLAIRSSSRHAPRIRRRRKKKEILILFITLFIAGLKSSVIVMHIMLPKPTSLRLTAYFGALYRKRT
jgi:hypothetical protein